jgi:methylmalonyl-CoA mutase N-terminal domain/subunit
MSQDAKRRWLAEAREYLEKSQERGKAMTIEVFGHVKSLGFLSSKRVLVEIQAMRRARRQANTGGK